MNRSSLFAQLRDRSAKLSNADFTVAHGEVSFRLPASVTDDPSIMLRLFEFIASHGVTPDAATQEAIADCLPTFETWLEAHPLVWPIFRGILGHSHAPRALQEMRQRGVLSAVLPGSAESGSAIMAIRSLFELRSHVEHPLGAIAAGIDDPHLLITAVLFLRDCKRDTAEKVLRRAGVSDRELAVISFLIESKDEMASATARRDVSDPTAIHEMASKTGTVERLRLLTVLTWADLGASDPEAMTPWREELIQNLYTATCAELTRELGTRIAQSSEIVNPDLRRFLNGMPPRYLRTRTEAEIQEHLRLEREGGWRGVSVSLTRSAAWMLTVVTSDRPYLFASIAAALTSFGFNILKAEAFSNEPGTAVDTFTFDDPSSKLEVNSPLADEVTKTVVRAVKGELPVAELLKRRPKVRAGKQAVFEPRASFDNTAATSATLIELVAQDRPGLLCDVATAVSKRGRNIEVVLVHTEANRAIDVLYVTRDGAKLEDEDAKELAAAIAAAARPA